MDPFVNIHTHKIPNDDSIYILNNRFGNANDFKIESFFSAGIHPWDVEQDSFSKLVDLEIMVKHHNCLAIGECGLDKMNNLNFELQKKVFEMHLQLARKFNKPIIIHCVKAFDELIELCNPYQNKVILLIHGFNKSQQLAKQLIKHGFYLSLSVSIFHKLEYDFSSIPLQRLFLETDINELISIDEVYEIASKNFKIKLDDLKEKIYSNFTTIFNKNGR